MYLKHISAVLGIVMFSGLAFAQSKDANNPTPIISNVFEGQIGPEGGIYYYSHVVPKGTLKVTVTGQTNEYSTPIRVNVHKKPGSDSLGEIYVIADDNPKTESRSYSFANPQTVIFSVRLEKDSTLKWQKYKVTLGTGPIIIPGKKGIMIPGKKGLPDLTAKEYDFVSANDKAVQVRLTNSGGSASGVSKLELTVRKINNSAVGRVLTVDIPVINPGETKFITIDVSRILPKSVRLQDTTFKFIVDSGNAVNESNETNNETWHNLN